MSTQNLYNQIKSKKKGIDMSFMKDIPSAGKSFVNETTWGVSTKTPTFRKETAQSTQAIPDESTPSTYNTVRDFGREILKDVGATGAGYDMRKGVDLKREFDPKTSRLGRMFGAENVYGTDKPFSISSQSESFSDLLGVESEKGKERVASIYGTLNLMDYVGVGVTKNVAEEAFKTIAKSTDRTVIAKVLRETFTGFDKKIADDVAIALDDVTDRNQVQAIIEKVMEVQKAKQPIMSKYSYTNLPPAKADEVVVSFVETGGDKQYINTNVENTKQYDGVPHFGTISKKLLNDTGDVNKTSNGVYTIPRALANKIVLEDTIPQAKRVPIRGEGGQFLGSFMDAPAKQVDTMRVKSQNAENEYRAWLRTQPDAVKLVDDAIEKAKTIRNPNAKQEFLQNTKREMDTRFLKEYQQRVVSAPKQAFTENGIEFDRTIREVEARLEEIFGRKIDINTTVDEDFLRAKKNKGDTSVTVYGRANAEAIYLLERNKSFSEAVANHEGWHWFKRNLSDTKRKELDALEQELMDARPDLVAKVKREYPDATPQELAEEVMADEFARYTRTGKTVSEKLKLFFDNAVEALLRVFKVRDDVMSRAEKEFSRVKKTLKEDGGVGAGESAAKQTKDTLDPKNYKSAEEFVKAKLPNRKVTENPNNYGETKTYKILEKSYNNNETSVVLPKGSVVFRGGEDGVFHSADLGTAESYVTGNAPLNAVDISGKKLANFQIFTDGKYASDPEFDLVAVLKKALDEGYDGLYSRDNYGEVILPTKKQLTNIWNKANEAPAKQVSNVDRLIAEGKIRVVSRDGRDVYQTQEGGKWVNRRDEDSAIKSLQPKPSKAIQVDPKLEERLLSAQISKEMLQEDPASALERYAVPTNRFVEKGFKDYRGQLPEVTGIDSRDPRAPLLRDTALKAERKLVKGKDYVNFKIGGDRYLSELGFNDTEEAREAYSKFLIRKADVEVEVKEAREAIKTARLEQKARLGESKAIAELTEPVYQRVPDTPEAIRTLENQAQEVLAGVEFSPNQKPLTLHEIVTQTPLQAKVNIVDYIRTPDRVLKKIGFAKEAKLLRDGYDKYVVELPTNIQKITDWSEGLPKEASERIFRYLDGEDAVLPENEKKIAGEMKVWLKQWADRLGLPDDNRITNYITHIFDEELIAKEFDEDLAKIITEKIPGQVYDPFLEKRLGAKGYKQDVWQALDAYTKRATRKVHIDPALQNIQDKAGSSLEFSNLEKSQFDYIQKYISRVNMRPTEIDNLIDTSIKQLFGYRAGQRPVARISQFMRRMTYRAFLGGNLGSALRNLSQGINTYAVLGERDTALGYMKLFSAENRKELAEQGIFANNFIQDRTINATRKLIEKADKGLWVFFDTAEKINRGSAYLGAKTKALRQGMAEQEAIDYAKSIVRKTQFNYDPVDTPVALSSDIVKTLLQFQTYTVKQTEFLTELAKDKNFVALARYALAGYGFVYTIGQAFGMEPKELLPINTDTWSRFELAPSLKIPKEIAKALMNVPDDYGSERDLEEKMKDIADTLWGLVPAGAQLKKSIKGYGALEEGGSFDSAGRKQFEVGGTTAKDTQAILFGKYANKEAKQYFDKDSGDNTFDKLKEKDLETKKEERTRLTQDVDALRDASKEEVKARLLELAKEDEAYAEKVLDALVEEKQGLSSVEKKLKNASVNVRAEYIMDKIDGLSKDEKKAMVQDYYTKGILTEAVLDKMIEMMGEGDIME